MSVFIWKVYQRHDRYYNKSVALSLVDVQSPINASPNQTDTKTKDISSIFFYCTVAPFHKGQFVSFAFSRLLLVFHLVLVKYNNPNSTFSPSCFINSRIYPAASVFCHIINKPVTQSQWEHWKCFTGASDHEQSFWYIRS